MLAKLLAKRFLELGYQDPELTKAALDVIKPYWLERVGNLITENHKLKTIFLKPSEKSTIAEALEQHGKLDVYLLLQILETKKLNAYYFGNSETH